MKFLAFAQTTAPKKRNQERNLRTFLIAFKIKPNLASKGLQITMEVQDTLYLCLNLYEHSISLPQATSKLNTNCSNDYKWKSVELRMKTTQYISYYVGLLILLHYYYYYRIPNSKRLFLKCFINAILMVPFSFPCCLSSSILT